MPLVSPHHSNTPLRRSLVTPSEFDRLVRLPALRATRAVHVRVIRIDVTTTAAAENPVFAGGGLEAPAAQFGVDAQPSQCGQQDGHVCQNQLRNGHAGPLVCLCRQGLGAGTLAGGVGTVCHRKIILPQLKCAVGLGPVSAELGLTGSNRARLACSKAYWSASVEPLPQSKVTNTGRPSASTTTWTTLLVRISGFDHAFNWSGVAKRLWARPSSSCRTEWSCNRASGGRSGSVGSASGWARSCSVPNRFVSINRGKPAPRRSTGSDRWSVGATHSKGRNSSPSAFCHTGPENPCGCGNVNNVGS